MDLEERIERSPAPDQVRLALARIRDLHPDLDDRLSEGHLAAALVATTSASRSLSRQLANEPPALEVLTDLDVREQVPLGGLEAVVGWKRREYLRIAARDLLGIDRLEETGSALAAMAREVLGTVCDLAGAQGLAVIGMGKLGGNELNYASDVDIIFVTDGDANGLEKSARQVMEMASRCFRVDANLRPEGRDGKLVRSLDSYEAYWDRWAQPWEFQALLKARPAAGDGALGERFLEAAQHWLWNRPVDAEALRSLRHLKERSEAEITKRGLTDREVKRGPGGIRDIEFTAQLLQLVHGPRDPLLRSPTTLELLRELANAGYFDEEDADELASAYRFLRAIEHRLQLVDERQVHTVPTDESERDHLARTLGFVPTPRAGALEQFEAHLRQAQLGVRLIHERVYFRPLLEAFAGSEGALSPEAAETQLAAFGFTDAKRTKAAVRELTRGLNRASRFMQQMLPLMLDWLSDAPDPDLGLLLLRNLLSGPQRQTQLLEAFRESPEVARSLCRVLGTSRLMGDTLTRNPDLVTRLPYPERLRTKPLTELVGSATRAASWREERGERQEALRRWKDRNVLGIQARDVLYAEGAPSVGSDLTRLAEASLEVALRGKDPPFPFAVVALGRFGGAELSYASDLDVIFVYDGEGATVFEDADRLGKTLLRFVGGSSPADRIYEIDAKLRPEGGQGPMARNVDGYVKYFERWAQVWERQAYARARTVAGDRDLGATLIHALEPFVWGEGLSSEDAREIRRMKARVETERIPVGEDPEFHLKLGRGSLSDIEWTAQLLQLGNGVRATGTVEALRALLRAGLLEHEDAETLIETYQFLERTRNRLYLVSSSASDSLPTQPEPLMWLARSLGTTSVELRDTYRRLTRRTRRVVDRVFYGKT